MLFNLTRQFYQEDVSIINHSLDKFVYPFACEQSIFRKMDISKLSINSGVIISKAIEINDANKLHKMNKVILGNTKPINRSINKDYVVAKRENIIFPRLVKSEIDPDEIVEHHLYMHVDRDNIFSKVLPQRVNRDLEEKGIEPLIPESIIFLNEPTIIIHATTNEVLNNFNAINNLARRVSKFIGQVMLGPLSLTPP